LNQVPKTGVLRTMAPRANWNGFLRLSLVTCPVALYPHIREREDFLQPAQSADRPSHQVPEGRCGHGRRGAERDMVKGYQLEKDQFIEVTKEELEEIVLGIHTHHRD
jgi:DNA end-binding protein Ku